MKLKENLPQKDTISENKSRYHTLNLVLGLVLSLISCIAGAFIFSVFPLLGVIMAGAGSFSVASFGRELFKVYKDRKIIKTPTSEKEKTKEETIQEINLKLVEIVKQTLTTIKIDHSRSFDRALRTTREIFTSEKILSNNIETILNQATISLNDADLNKIKEEVKKVLGERFAELLKFIPSSNKKNEWKNFVEFIKIRLDDAKNEVVEEIEIIQNMAKDPSTHEKMSIKEKIINDLYQAAEILSKLEKTAGAPLLDGEEFRSELEDIRRTFEHSDDISNTLNNLFKERENIYKIEEILTQENLTQEDYKTISRRVEELEKLNNDENKNNELAKLKGLNEKTSERKHFVQIIRDIKAIFSDKALEKILLLQETIFLGRRITKIENKLNKYIQDVKKNLNGTFVSPDTTPNSKTNITSNSK